MIDTCYLCGRSLSDAGCSADHVVPKTLIARTQPKVKGFDYAGTLPTHTSCNNEFGPETYAGKAIELLDALHNPEVFHEYRHPKDPSIRMMAVNSAALPTFTRRDLQFFRIIDVRARTKDQLHDLSLIEGSESANPMQQALVVALAVLTKSAAALIVSRKLKSVPNAWDVLAMPFVGDVAEHGFDDLFGGTEPFDIGLKVWLGKLETGDFLTIYRAKKVLVFFLFRFSDTTAAWDKMLLRFPNATRLRFHGPRLLDVLKNSWERV